MINLNKLIVLDIETLINCFIVCCRDVKTGAKKQFIIYDHAEYEDQPLALYKFLRNCVRNGYSFVTFNGLGFDIPILDYFYEWCEAKNDPLYNLHNSEVIKFLYNEAQRVIHLTDDQKHTHIKHENKLFIKTIDLFKQKHYDRPQKYTSLKWVQFTMQYPNIEEMPISHDTAITKDQITEVVDYCWNDVDSTYEFYTRIKFETEARLALSKKYKKNLINASEPRMAREIFGKFLCDEMGIDYPKLKQMKTIREKVAFKDIIFPYVKFINPDLKNVFNHVRDIVLDTSPNVKPSFEYNFNYHGLTVYLGLGGIHSCVNSGVYVGNEDEIFEDADVVSFYPKLAIENNVYPEHLGIPSKIDGRPVFSKIYSSIFDQRQLIPKEDPENYIFKILLNSAYGLSSEINSYFYDRKFTYTITINGQLSLLMLVEALYISVPGIRFIQKNTDGVTYIYKKEYEPIVRKICNWWQKTTKLKLEYAYYSKMVIADVNNYLAIDTKGKLKKKGIFETEIQYHKNPSYLIVPKSLEQHYVNNKPVEETIKNHDNIYDFCGGIKKKSNFTLNLYKSFSNTEIVEEQQKVTRFIVSTQTDDAGLLVKDFNDGRKVSALANTLVTPLNIIKNEYKDPKRYPINYDWYTKEARKIIDNISPSTIQATLF